MGREIRKVKKGWEHPKDDKGHYQPMHDEYYGDAVNDWYNNHLLWMQGQHPDQISKDRSDYKFYAEWDGNCPKVEYYLKEKWSEEEANCFQMYETVSEGTPVSPVFESLKDLEDWLVAEGHTRKAAQSFCETGYAPSMVFNTSTGVMKSNIDIYDL